MRSVTSVTGRRNVSCVIRNLSPRLRSKFADIDAIAEKEEVAKVTTPSSRFGISTRLASLASKFMTHNAAAAVFNTSRVRLVTTDQANLLLRESPRGRALDIGAGSGDVTRAFRPLFETMEAVEVSAMCRRRLLSVCDRVHAVMPSTSTYDVVVLANVLDRCNDPMGLISSARDALVVPNGALFVSIAYPWTPFSIEGGDLATPRSRTCAVDEDLSNARSFEDFVTIAHETMFRDFDVVTLARANYECTHAGDPTPSVLDCALFVLRAND